MYLPIRKLIINEITGKINQAGIISRNNLSELSLSKYMATAVTDKTVDWLVDCGIPNKLATSNEMETENNMMVTTFRDIISGESNSLPIVVAVDFPASIAPKKTIIPNNPGIRLLRSTFAPYAAEKAGPVPLPPIFIAKKIAIIKGNNKGLKSGEIIIFGFIINQLRILPFYKPFFQRSKIKRISIL